MSAPPAAGAAEPVGQDPALEVLAQIPLDEAWDGIPIRFGLPHTREPGLQMLLNQLVDDRLLRPSGTVDRGGVPSGPREGASGDGRPPCRML
jgi:hypothetical protein